MIYENDEESYMVLCHFITRGKHFIIKAIRIILPILDETESMIK